MQNVDRKKGKSLKEYVDTFVVFDFETTGLNVKDAEIIQIGAVKFENGVETAVFDKLVKPENPIPPRVTRITGITDLDVCMADGIDSVLKDFLAFIDNYILLGYNITSFDTTLLYDYAMHLYGKSVSNNFIDLRYIAERYIKKNNISLPNCKLPTISDYFGIDISNAHNALGDCYMTYQCYQKIFNKSDKSDINIPATKVNNITNSFEQKIFDILQTVIAEEELPTDCLYLFSNVSRGSIRKGNQKGKEITKSICVHEPDYPIGSQNVNRIGKNDTFAKISYNQKRNNVTFQIQNRFLSEIAIPSSAKIKTTETEKVSNIVFSLDDNSIYQFVKSVVLIGLKYYESNSSFSCCSQFTRCSDEKKCVHENKLYSKGCKYRKNLEAGRIFYGKNKNIDV